MSDIFAGITQFLESYLLEILILVVAWMIFSDLRSGKIRSRFGRIFTRTDNPFRYWFWILFQAVALAGLLLAWSLGFDFTF